MSLTDILNAREIRWRAREEKVFSSAVPVLSLSLVIPGPVKNSPLFERLIFSVADDLEQRKMKDLIYDRQVLRGADGISFLWGSRITAMALKIKSMELEDKGIYGRAIDLDIMDVRGNILSREYLNREPRKCLICDRVAKICSVGRTHSAEELMRALKIIYVQSGLMVESEYLP